jgi:hypothetical protein
MKKIQLFLVLIVMAAGMVWLTGYMSQEELAFQGKWANGNAHFWAEWNFNGGEYSYYYDDGFTTISETGRYRIVKTADDYIDLELFNRKGGVNEMMDERVQMRITFQQGGGIRINGNDYVPVSESSLWALDTAEAPQGK